MSAERVQGLAEAVSMLDRLPAAARHQLADKLGRIGREGLLAQKAATPVGATGNLRTGLSMQLLTETLRVRFGLLGLPVSSKSALRRQRKTGIEGRNLANLYYGRFVYFGRKAQTVEVQRRKVGAYTYRSKRAQDIAATYSLHIKPRAPMPYINAPGDDFTTIAATQLAQYWTDVLAEAGE